MFLSYFALVTKHYKINTPEAQMAGNILHVFYF